MTLETIPHHPNFFFCSLLRFHFLLRGSNQVRSLFFFFGGQKLFESDRATATGFVIRYMPNALVFEWWLLPCCRTKDSVTCYLFNGFVGRSVAFESDLDRTAALGSFGPFEWVMTIITHIDLTQTTPSPQGARRPFLYFLLLFLLCFFVFLKIN